VTSEPVYQIFRISMKNETYLIQAEFLGEL
jgi:hypothetical protein